MSSGGDLDGDEYFVCWDQDIVQPYVLESYDYPGNKEAINPNLKREDLAKYFAFFNNASVARVSALHHKWLKAKGATSRECQELNALHSQSVDGGRIRIPDALKNPPEPQEPFILDMLKAATNEFFASFAATKSRITIPTVTSPEEAKLLLVQLLRSEQQAISEYELFNIALDLSRKHKVDLRPFLPHLNYGALTTEQKYAVSAALGLSKIDEPALWNSLFRSDILTRRDLYQRALDQPFSLHRLYSARVHGTATFFTYLKMATQEYTRKLLIIRPDSENRFALGIFIHGDVPWDEVQDPAVQGNVVVCSFMPQTAGTLAPYKPCTPGYRLHLGEGRVQLYFKNIAGTFVFISRPARAPGKEQAEVITSIALQMISGHVRNQLGRVQRTPVPDIEIHVVSNRDRVAHQLFDLWFQHVHTEQKIRRFEREVRPYERNNLDAVEWTLYPGWIRDMFQLPGQNMWTKPALHSRSVDDMKALMDFCLLTNAHDQLFTVFESLLDREIMPRELVRTNMEKYPGLAFVVLKLFPPDEQGLLPEDVLPIGEDIVRCLIKAANQQGMAVLVALEKLPATIHAIPSDRFIDIIFLTPLCVRSRQLVQEVLLVLTEQRLTSPQDSPLHKYAHKHALGVAFDRAEEAADTCPCDENGKPRKQKTPPLQATLKPVEDHPKQVKARVWIDARTTIRLHSHVRVQAASHPDKGPEWIETHVMDGLVARANRGELIIDLLYPAPAEMERMDWNIYDAGSTATAQAMIDALTQLVRDASECCAYQHIITGDRAEEPVNATSVPAEDAEYDGSDLNVSQQEALFACDRSPLSLIWGPPGTGKTTVVVQILRRLLQNSDDETKILMTASTHNAVDNVLERFIAVNKTQQLLSESEILRVATDNTKVNPALQEYTINARVGGDMNENNKLFKAAQKRLEQAKVVFSTAAGSGLGILRKASFDIALIDEASQVTEPCSLIPLVKGTRKAILVGDHVQLRPTVQRMGKALEYDVSLMERLYTQTGSSEMTKTMLKIQYRFPQELARFPSREFYNGELISGIQDPQTVLRVLSYSSFPWPRRGEGIVPTVFVPCGEEEDMSGRMTSKQNIGQARMVAHIVQLLRSPAEHDPPLDATQTAELEALKVTVLCPYTAQRQLIENRVQRLGVSCSTVDSFQGRESDVIVFSTVRCNPSHEVGFLEDARRLNVMWTRAKKGLIIVGDAETLKEGSALWKRAVESCEPVTIAVPEQT